MNHTDNRGPVKAGAHVQRDLFGTPVDPPRHHSRRRRGRVVNNMDLTQHVLGDITNPKTPPLHLDRDTGATRGASLVRRCRGERSGTEPVADDIATNHEGDSTMFPIERTGDALAAAHDAVKTARKAGLRHGSFPDHLSDLRELLNIVTTLVAAIALDAGNVAKAYAHALRHHYHDGHAPDGQPWPDNVLHAVDDAAQALTQLGQHPTHAPALAGCHSALETLRVRVKTVWQAQR